MKTLSIDIETRPNLVYRWDLFDKQSTPINMIVEPTRMICFAAKWLGEPEIFFHSEYTESRKEMLDAAWQYLDEADVLLHYNGNRFDEPKINAEFIKLDMWVPSPYRRIDLYKAVKSRFSFPSLKLNYVSKELGLGQKVEHEGWALWQGCMAGDPESWEKMEEYNKQDVVLNEKLYDYLLPWIPGLPSYGAELGADVCPACGSEELRREGHAYTKTGKYQRYRCNQCGTWSRSSRRDSGTKIVQVAA